MDILKHPATRSGTLPSKNGIHTEPGVLVSHVGCSQLLIGWNPRKPSSLLGQIHFFDGWTVESNTFLLNGCGYKMTNLQPPSRTPRIPQKMVIINRGKVNNAATGHNSVRLLLKPWVGPSLFAGETNLFSGQKHPKTTSNQYVAEQSINLYMVGARIIERKLRSTKVRLFTVPCCSIILFSSEGRNKKTCLNLLLTFFVVL